MFSLKAWNTVLSVWNAKTNRFRLPKNRAFALLVQSARPAQQKQMTSFIELLPGKAKHIEIKGRAGQCLHVKFDVYGGRCIDFFSAVLESGEPLFKTLRVARAADFTCDPLEADGVIHISWDNTAAWLYRYITYTAEMVDPSAVQEDSGNEATPRETTMTSEKMHDDLAGKNWTEMFLAAGAAEEVSAIAEILFFDPTSVALAEITWQPRM